MKTYKMNNEGTRMMLEDAEGKHRYEFFTRAIMKSNIDHTVAYYEPIVRYCQKFATGSTYIDRRVSVEEGNQLFKELKADGYKLVEKRTFV